MSNLESEAWKQQRKKIEEAFEIAIPELMGRANESSMGFCFGCDEGRHGKYIETKRMLGNQSHEEHICKGCNFLLTVLRPLMIPVVQESSHEGIIIWRIERRYYGANESILKEYLEENEEESGTYVRLMFSDAGEALDLIKKLTRIRLETSATFN